MVRRRGVGSMGCLLWLVVIAACVYFGGSYANAYFDYYRYKDAMKQEAKFSLQHSDVQIQSRLRNFADSLGLPASASRVRVRRGKSRVVISGSYVQSIPVPLIGVRKVRFNPKAEAAF